MPYHDVTHFYIWCAILLILYFLKALITYVITYWGHKVGVLIQADMRQELFHKLQKLPFSYYDENKTGTIMSRIINDLQEISELAHHGPEDTFTSVLTLIGSFIVVCVINWRLGLLVFAIIPFLIFFAGHRRKVQKNSFKQMRIKTAEINAEVESSIAGIRVAKAYTAEDHEASKFDTANKNFQNARMDAYHQMGIFHAGMSFFTDFLYFIVLFVGGIFFLNNIIDAGDYTTFILYIATLISPIRTLVNLFEQIQSGASGFDRFVEIMEQAVENEDENAKDLEVFKNKIEFKDVSFKYKHDDEAEQVLSHLNLVIKKGQTVALVGPSGGGKTTICHLIPRFYEVDDGHIYIDDLDVRDLTLKSIRSKIGIVQQDVFLFAGSIRENIAYGNLDASEEQIIEASKNANIYEFAMSLPDGLDTYVGERGVQLSGGQKQRISIARAFLKNPDILILDEATSALDNVTEMQIQSALEKLSKGRTTIVVAHRLSTIKAADEIVVITEKGVEEKGNHEQLLAKDGIYANLYNELMIE